MEIVKKFAFISTTSSVTERKNLFDELFTVLKDEKNGNWHFYSIMYLNNKKLLKTTSDMPEAVYKALGKLIYYMFPKYTDKTSKNLLIKFNDSLLKANLDQSLKSIISGLELHANFSVGTQPK